MHAARTAGFLFRAHATLGLAALLAAPRLAASALAQGPPATQSIVSLCSIPFEATPKLATRMERAGRDCLDDVALNLQKQPDSSLAVIGNARSSERSSAVVAAKRAVAVKRYLVMQKGISQKRITIYTGHQDASTVSTSLLPPHAVLDASLVVPVDESRLR